MSTPGGNLYFRSCKPNSEVEVGVDEEDTELPYEEGLADATTRQFAFEILRENVSTNEYLNRFWENIESLNRGEEFDAGDDEDAGVFNTNEEVYFHTMKNDYNEEEYGEGERGSVAEGSSRSLPLSLDEAEEKLDSAGEFEEHSTMPHLLQNFTRLKAIDISGYGIKSVKTIGPMIPYVLKINAPRNEIRTFLDIETPPVALKEADFSHNQISTVRNLSSFWALTDIDLSYNDLTTVHGFSDLEFLQTLNVSHNRIESIRCLKCPNLLILYLNSNLLKEVSGLEECTTLKCINLNKNKISSLQGLKFMASLTDLYISDNNISNIFEFENVRSLLNLTHIRVEPGNPIQTLENWRLVLIHMLPQLLFMDGQRLDPVEIRLAENIFRPSFKKTALLDHAGILLDKACQAANSIFEIFNRTRQFPPLLLLVGPPRSHCHTLALLLKQKFKNKVFLGGVHSTATTVEGSHPHLDIPVSFESFVQMKNSGEFLCTSHILGRVCGFSTSQIARAAEKGAVLVANVPLSIAISLREWNFKPRLVLIMSKSAPAFYENEQRIATINRHSQMEDEERRQSSVEEDGYEDDGLLNLNEENKDHHRVSFSETPVVASILKKERESIGEDDEDLKLLVKDEFEGAKTDEEEEVEEFDAAESREEDEALEIGEFDATETEEVEAEEIIEYDKAAEKCDEFEPTENGKEVETAKSKVDFFTAENKEEFDITENDNEKNDPAEGENEEVECNPEEDKLEENEEDSNPQIHFSDSNRRFSSSEQQHYERHIEAMMESIIQTREEYALFHEENPGFFHLVLDATDLCDTFEKLADFATSSIRKLKDETSKRSMVKSHGGNNKTDEQNFAAERLRDLKKSAMLWTKGHDVLSTHDHVERKPNYWKEVNPREFLLEKSSPHSNLLDPTLLKPKITLKMKRIVEFHEKQLKCFSK